MTSAVELLTFNGEATEQVDHFRLLGCTISNDHYPFRKLTLKQFAKHNLLLIVNIAPLPTSGEKLSSMMTSLPASTASTASLTLRHSTSIFVENPPTIRTSLTALEQKDSIIRQIVFTHQNIIKII